MSIKLILTDLDETLLNWREPFELWARKHKGFKPNNSIQECKNLEEWLNISYDESHKLIREFNRTLMFGALEPYPQAKEYIPRLFNQGYRFVGITAVDYDNWTHNLRWKNLEHLFPGAFLSLHCSGISQEKTEYLKLYRPTWWVEDKMHHAIAGSNVGHKSFLISYNFNLGDYHDSVKRVNGWEDIYYCVTDDGCGLPGWMA